MPYKKRKSSTLIKDNVERWDLFGAPISLNIDGYNDSFKTVNGLMFSVIVYLLFGLYLHIIMSNILDGSNTQI
jgi:hypothetical protein